MKTIQFQVAAALPNTSYFKMVDVWLLFCIFATFLVIVFHVLVDRTQFTSSHPKQPNPENSKEWKRLSRGFFLHNRHQMKNVNNKFITLDNKTQGQKLNKKAEMIQVQSKNLPLAWENVPDDLKNDESDSTCFECQCSGGRMTFLSKVCIFAVFLIFNAGYWGFIRSEYIRKQQ